MLRMCHLEGVDRVKLYSAHYQSPRGANPVNGTFEFESAANAGSKKNMSDARIKMLELFGNEALSWTIDHIERIGSGEANQYVQMQLDFREPKKARVRRTVDRGKVGPSN